MKYFVTHAGDEFEVTIHDREEGGYSITLGDHSFVADLARLSGEDIFSLILNGKSYELLAQDGAQSTRVVHHGRALECLVESERERNARLIAVEGGGAGGETVRAVMPGIVVSIAVKEGDAVKSGQPLLVLEAMKMENEIRSTTAGVVLRVAVQKGQTVNGGDCLLEIGHPPE